MTPEEFERDVIKFTDYLNANGARLVCGLLVVDDANGNRMVLKAGSKEDVLHGFAVAAVEGTGFKVKRGRRRK